MAAGEQLQRGRALWTHGAWGAAHDALVAAGRDAALEPEDLRLLGIAAYMLGREEEYVAALDRVHEQQLRAGATEQAALTAFWIGMHLMTSGEIGRGGGWIGRAQRLVEALDEDCIARGYLLLPLAFRHEMSGDCAAAAAIAGQAVAIAQRHGDSDLFALAVHVQGRVLVLDGRIAEGLALFDEAMLALTSGELSPIARGIVYCGVILGCQAAYDMRRAQEWTEALSSWCERQQDLVAFSGRCHVHRAEIMALRGAWSQALDEARCASERAARNNQRRALGEAAYVQGEVHRLRGATAAAERAYFEASEHGRDPQPGLALLRVVEGNVEAAVSAIERALGETRDPLSRARLLPACNEILLAAGDVDRASEVCAELAQIAARLEGADMLGAVAARAQGAVALAGGDPGGALLALRRAWRAWTEASVPYEAARTRELMGRACAKLGDDEAAALELAAARRVLDELGAVPDVARIDALTGAGAGASSRSAGGLSGRELEVLRLVAQGRTNRAIADELVLSERTVERHVSNICTKLRVASRTAATAYAYEHGLI
jgi:DNA-binding CsgD family transcriptional regulator